ncbi:MAG: hypothetical protein ABI197_12740 [Granulicella sp.]
MKKQLLMLGMLLLPTLAMAVTPDFSGTWAKDSASSDPVPNQMYWMTRVAPVAPRRGGGQRAAPVILLTVRQDAKTLHVVDSQSAIHEYTIDGDDSPHSKPMDTGIQKSVVTAKLQADNLVIETTEPFGGMPGNVTLKIKEVWALAPDGKTLTITTTRDIPARHQEYKQVYTRTQDQPGTICSDGCVPAH